MSMKYLMLVCVDPSVPLAAGDDGDVDPWVDEMTRRSVRLLGSPVARAEHATTVRVRDGELSVTDGPFAEAKEQMVGFDLIECADLDEAIEIASKHPLARRGAMDIRPFIDV
jgi:hypothetical protein